MRRPHPTPASLALALLATLALAVVGCGGGGDAAPAAPAVSVTPNQSEVEFYLGGMDDWVLTAELEPWPPTAGTEATLRVEAGMDDFERSFDGRVEYRLAESEYDFPEWLPTTLVRSSEEVSVFEATFAVPQGENTLYLRVKRSFDDEPYELDGWRFTLP